MYTEAERIALLEEEKRQLREQLEAATAKIKNADKKSKFLKDRLSDVEVRYRKVVESNLKHEDKYTAIENEMATKVANIKRKLAFHMSKEQKIKTLADTIKIAIQQSKLEMGANRLSKGTILRARLSKLVNTFETIFGGVVMLGPLNIPENSTLALSKDPNKKFLQIIFSKTARTLAKFMGMTTHNLPVLERSPISQYVIDSREPYFPDISLLRLPPNHFEMKKALFVPIVVDGKPMGLAGFANGNYDKEDSHIIMEILTTAWLSVLSEGFKDSQITQSIFAQALPQHIIDRMMAYELEGSSYGDTDRSNMSSSRSYSGSSQIIIADTYPSASIVFCDIVGFTRRSSQLPPEEVVSFLNTFFCNVDTIVEDRKLEKIKTIGDCYMVACGIPNRDPNHAELAADFALDILELSHEFHLGDSPIELRVGIHSGPIVAGVIGRTKLTYDVWGDTVNKASRMESTGTPGSIQITEETYRFLNGNPKYNLEPRGVVNVHGLGNMSTYFLKRGEGSKEKRSPSKANSIAMLTLNLPKLEASLNAVDMSLQKSGSRSPIPSPKPESPPKLPVLKHLKKPGRRASFSI